MCTQIGAKSFKEGLALNWVEYHGKLKVLIQFNPGLALKPCFEQLSPGVCGNSVEEPKIKGKSKQSP